MILFYFTMKRFFRSFINLFLLFVLPFGLVFLPKGQWPPLPMGFQYYGMALLFIAARLTGSIQEDRSTGTALRIAAAPVTHFQYLWQNLLAFSVILTGLNVFFILAGVWIHGSALTSPLLLFIVYSFFSMTAIGFSLAWHSLFRNKEAAFAVIYGVVILMVMLGGLLWPIQAFPLVFQRIAMLLPIYWLAEGVGKITSGGTLLDLTLSLVMLWMYSLVFLLLGSRRKIT